MLVRHMHFTNSVGEPTGLPNRRSGELTRFKQFSNWYIRLVANISKESLWQSVFLFYDDKILIITRPVPQLPFSLLHHQHFIVRNCN